MIRVFSHLLSTGNGMTKRYGLVYIDVTDEQPNKVSSAYEAD